MIIQPGQIYQQCNPQAIYPARIRIDTIQDGHADFTYLTTSWPGIIHGAIRLDQLHTTPLTRDGKPRRTGYALEQP